MTPQHFASLALETWRASGHRTEARRDSLLVDYLCSYFGPVLTWTEDTHQLRISAIRQLRQWTRIDELVCS